MGCGGERDGGVEGVIVCLFCHFVFSVHVFRGEV